MTADTGSRSLVRLAVAAAPLRRQVVETLRDAIAEGRFEPGERLIERELCESLGVSRPSLREALRELETEGIVTSVANKGVIVRPISVRGARETYEVREMLEGLLAERFAQLATGAQLASLEASVVRLAAAYASQTGLLAAKRDFYDALCEGADHDLASDMLRGIQLRVGQLRRMTLSDPDRSKQSLAEIRALMKAIKRRDGTAAGEAARLHVRNAGALALRLLERREHAPTQAARSAAR